MQLRIAAAVTCAAVAIASSSSPVAAQAGYTTIGTVSINSADKSTITVQVSSSGQIRAYAEDGVGTNAVVLDATASEARAWADRVGAILAAAPEAPAGVPQDLNSPSFSAVRGISLYVSRTARAGSVGGLTAPYFVFASDEPRLQSVSGVATAETVRRLVELMREAATAAERTTARS